MATFKAKNTDLLLELTTFKGEEIKLDANVTVTANKAASMIKKIADMDAEIVKNKDTVEVVKVLGEQLATIYGKGSKWWGDNFDFALLVEIKTWVLGQLSGIKKNVES